MRAWLDAPTRRQAGRHGCRLADRRFRAAGLRSGSRIATVGGGPFVLATLWGLGCATPAVITLWSALTALLQRALSGTRLMSARTAWVWVWVLAQVVGAVAGNKHLHEGSHYMTARLTDAARRCTAGPRVIRRCCRLGQHLLHQRVRIRVRLEPGRPGGSGEFGLGTSSEHLCLDEDGYREQRRETSENRGRARGGSRGASDRQYQPERSTEGVGPTPLRLYTR